jgi:serine/threonine protein kinase
MQNLDHPNIAEYFESYDDPKYKYICTELVEGDHLIAHVIKREKPLTENDCAGYIIKLAKALQHCHQ